MNKNAESLAVLLTAVSPTRSITPILEESGFTIVSVPSGAMALELTRHLRPDVVMVEANLPDMSGLDVCRRMRGNPAVGRNVPIILMVREKPSPEQRVNALRAGVWEFLQVPGDRDEILLKLHTCLEAKRNVDAARADGFTDWARGLDNQSAFTQRARQIGALMARMHAPLACIVFEVDTDEPDPEAGEFVTQSVRASDIAGEISSNRFGVLAPATSAAGAVVLATRVVKAFAAMTVDRSAIRGTLPVPWKMCAGYDAVSNAMYSPIDPAPFIARASMAVRGGTLEPGSEWVRRFPTPPAVLGVPPTLQPALARLGLMETPR
ncbi:MAG: response regulator [Gemmatimonadales bacterium]